MNKVSINPIYKVLSLIMAAAMIFGCLPVLAAAQDSANIATSGTTSGGGAAGQNLDTATSGVTASAASFAAPRATGAVTIDVHVNTLAELQDEIDNAPDNDETVIAIDRNIPGEAKQIEIPANKEIVLTSDTGETFTITRGIAGNLFSVNGGASLTLVNITINGNGAVYSANNAPLVYVDSHGTFIMKSDATLENNRNIAFGGGGVDCRGTFYMYDGTIRGNIIDQTGGGMLVYGTSSAEASLYMYGGEISGNTARTGGGIFLGEYATAIMEDGTISNNEANQHATGGGGVYVNHSLASGNSTFIMNGGLIDNNRAIDSNGGGVNSYGNFTLTGGTISNNTTNGLTVGGGGVFVASGSHDGNFTMTGGKIIGNSVTNGYGGGGLYCHGAGSRELTVNVLGGEISGNDAISGGGVYIDGDIFTLTDATISGNTASSNGGGVHVKSGGVIMASGEISGNTASSNGSGVYVEGGTFTLGGTVVIEDNLNSFSYPNNVFLTSGRYIKLGTAPNAPAPGMNVHVQTLTPGGLIVTSDADPITRGYFTADDSTKVVLLVNDDQLEIGNGRIVTLTVKKDGALWEDHGKTFKLVGRVSGKSYSGASHSSTVHIAVPSGSDTYDLYDGATDAGVEIESTDTTAEINYYSISYSATPADAAASASISATYGGAGISSGAVVLPGKTLVLTASGTGAGTYTYLWNGTGATDKTTATQTISNLSGKIEATCVVTGKAVADVSVPIEKSKTTNSITVYDVTVTGNNEQVAEYAIGATGTSPGAWQSGTTFSGLTPNTVYYVFARAKESTNFNAGTHKVSAPIRTNASGKGDGANVSVPEEKSKTTNSITVYDVTVTGNNEQVAEYAIGATGTSPGAWQSGTTFIGLTPNTVYYVFARAKESTNYNTGTPKVSLPIRTNVSGKGDGANVSVPVEESKAISSIIVYAVTVTGNNEQVAEYAIGTNNTTPSGAWQNGTAFSGLNADTVYYVFARAKESANYNAGAIKVSLPIRTNAPPVPPPTPPAPPVVTVSSGEETEIESSYWIEPPEARTMSKYAQRQALDYARSRRSTITGIRAESLHIMAEAGLYYQHDMVKDNVVQIRVSVNDPGKAVKDILVSGYLQGELVDWAKAKFEKMVQSKVAVISMEQQGNFGITVQIAAKADLSGMDVDNLYFYSYNKKTNQYTQIETEYKIDRNGYVHFLTLLAGDIIVSDVPFDKQEEAQIEEPQNNPETGGDGDVSGQPQREDFHNPSMGGEYIVDNVHLSTELKRRDSSIVNNVATIDVKGNLNSRRSYAPTGPLLACIMAVLALAAIIMWALIPRKGDELIPIEEYRRSYLSIR